MALCCQPLRSVHVWKFGQNMAFSGGLRGTSPSKRAQASFLQHGRSLLELGECTTGLKLCVELTP